METTVQAQEIEHGAAKVASGDSHLDDGWVTLVPNGAVPSHIRQTRAPRKGPSLRSACGARGAATCKAPPFTGP